ncbi:hypothetical protein RB213_008024 [Colletotrichum asianum]
MPWFVGHQRSDLGPNAGGEVQSPNAQIGPQRHAKLQVSQPTTQQ